MHVDTAQRVVDRVRIAEAHVLELDVAVQPGHGNRRRGRGHGRRRLEQLGDARHGDACLLIGVEHLRQLLDRREEEVQVQQEGDQLADRQRAVGDEHTRRPEHHTHSDVRQEVHEREVGGDEPLRAHPGVPVTGRDFLELLLVAFLAHERL